MLLDVTWLRNPTARFHRFTYRAHNPLIVNKPIIIKGCRTGPQEITVWAESGEDGTVGMTGVIELYSKDPPKRAANKTAQKSEVGSQVASPEGNEGETTSEGTETETRINTP